mmetsp:Transcript_2482/g.5826  ORF Transcript_2482/g.5826 Transcript_2482/m.5826 type:complete len:370 (-) Transcript_2482:159-1268(-)
MADQSMPPVAACRSRSSASGSDPKLHLRSPENTTPSATASATDAVRDTAKPNMTMSSKATDQSNERTLAIMDSIMIRSSRKNLRMRTIRMMRANLRMRMSRKTAVFIGISARAMTVMISSAVEHATMTKSKRFHHLSSPRKNAEPKPSSRAISSHTKIQQKRLPARRMPSGSSCEGLLAAASAWNPRKAALSTIKKHMRKSNLSLLTTALMSCLTLPMFSDPNSSSFGLLVILPCECSRMQFFSPRWKEARPWCSVWPTSASGGLRPPCPEKSVNNRSWPETNTSSFCVCSPSRCSSRSTRADTTAERALTSAVKCCSKRSLRATKSASSGSEDSARMWALPCSTQRRHGASQVVVRLGEHPLLTTTSS